VSRPYPPSPSSPVEGCAFPTIPPDALAGRPFQVGECLLVGVPDTYTDVVLRLTRLYTHIQGAVRVPGHFVVRGVVRVHAYMIRPIAAAVKGFRYLGGICRYQVVRKEPSAYIQPRRKPWARGGDKGDYILTGITTAV
jgi:hypothetical protein